MATQQNFRSALNGFNREDVVRYIEYLNSKHTAEVNQLRSELEFLRSKETAAPAEPETDPVIEEQAARIQELEAQLAALKQELADAQNQCAAQTKAELEAYRRAERTERLARERAEQVYHQANGVLADATVKVDEAADQIGALTEQVMGQLTQLQAAVCGSKQALQDAAATMYALRPATDNE